MGPESILIMGEDLVVDFLCSEDSDPVKVLGGGLTTSKQDV
jgi:hypothetical protein